MTLTPLAPLRWTLPLVLAGSIYSLFKIMDENSSDAAREKLSTFLTTQRYEPYLGVLPDLVHENFVRSFGNHQISWKCLSRSFVTTAVAVLLSCLFSAFYNPHSVIKIVENFDPTLNTLHQAFAKSPKTQGAALFVAVLQKRQSLIWVLPILWILTI